jgi:PAS domain S-box-containing protein
MPEHRIYGVGGAGHLVDAKNTECTDDQEATNRSSERLSDLLTLSYEPMLAWRLDGVIEFWNAGAERLYGFAADEAAGRSSHSLLQTKFPIEFIEFVSQLRSKRYWSGQLQHICKDGHEVIVGQPDAVARR